jgi:hypothetical protein
MFPKEWGPYGNRHPFPEPYLAYPSGSPVKEPSLQVPIIKLPQREMPQFLEPSFIHHSTMSLIYEPPSRFPSGAPMERDACLQSFALHILQGPQ